MNTVQGADAALPPLSPNKVIEETMMSVSRMTAFLSPLDDAVKGVGAQLLSSWSHLCTYAFTILTCLLVLSLCVFLCRVFLRRRSEVEDEERKRRNVVKQWLQVNRKRAATKNK